MTNQTQTPAPLAVAPGASAPDTGGFYFVDSSDRWGRDVDDVGVAVRNEVAVNHRAEFGQCKSPEAAFSIFEKRYSDRFLAEYHFEAKCFHIDDISIAADEPPLPRERRRYKIVGDKSVGYKVVCESGGNNSDNPSTPNKPPATIQEQ